MSRAQKPYCHSTPSPRTGPRESTLSFFALEFENIFRCLPTLVRKFSETSSRQNCATRETREEASSSAAGKQNADELIKNPARQGKIPHKEQIPARRKN